MLKIGEDRNGHLGSRRGLLILRGITSLEVKEVSSLPLRIIKIENKEKEL